MQETYSLFTNYVLVFLLESPTNLNEGDTCGSPLSGTNSENDCGSCAEGLTCSFEPQDLANGQPECFGICRTIEGKIIIKEYAWAIHEHKK